jgi:hypothetical protein
MFFKKTIHTWQLDAFPVFGGLTDQLEAALWTLQVEALSQPEVWKVVITFSGLWILKGFNVFSGPLDPAGGGPFPAWSLKCCHFIIRPLNPERF